MDGSFRLLTHERNALLKEMRRSANPERRLRAHVLLLLDDGWSWNVIVGVLFTSTSTINRWRQRYLAGGLTAVLEPPRSRRPCWRWWTVLVIHWVTLQSPRDFGFYVTVHSPVNSDGAGRSAKYAWTASPMKAKTLRDCWRQVSTTVRIVSTKRLPRALCVPKDSFRQMTA
jgi:hypothetical protein